MPLIGTIKNTVESAIASRAIGKLTVLPEDPKLRKLTSIDPTLMMAAVDQVKDLSVIDLALYPHQEGGFVMMMRDSYADAYDPWMTVCPVIFEEQQSNEAQ